MKYQLNITSGIGYWPNCGEYVREVLARHEGKHVDVYINSLGGSVVDALDIRQQFLEHGDVTCHIFGMTASAATIIASGAKEIRMDKQALLLIHNSSSEIFKWGSANKEKLDAIIKEFQKQRDKLETVDDIIASCYADRAENKSLEDFKQLMCEERWIKANEAKDMELIDEVSSSCKPKKKTKDSVTDDMRCSLVALGFPVPENIEQEIEDEKLVDRIVEKILAIFKANKQPEAEGTDEAEGETNNITMKKFTLICAALALEALAIEDGKTALTEDQLKTVEDALAKAAEQKSTAEQKVTDLENKVAELEQQVKNLKNAPGAETHQQHEDAEDDEVSGKLAHEMYNRFKDIL